MKTGNLLAAVLALALSAEAALIPEERLGLWVPGNTIGVPGGIPTRTNIHVTISATNNEDITAKLQSAMASCPSNQVVQIPSGTFSLSYGPEIPDNITVRGMLTNTIVKPVNWAFWFHGSLEWPVTGMGIVSGYTRGSSNIVIQTPTPSAVGHVARIYQDNDTTNLVFGAEHAQAQFVHIVSSDSGGNVTFWPPLNFGLNPSLNPSISIVYVYSPRKNSGLEDLVIDASDSSYEKMVIVSDAYGCWCKGVTITNFSQYGFYFQETAACELRQCFLDRSREAAMNHGGVMMYSCGGLWMEDNIAHRVFPAVELNDSSSGNAFSYNYIFDVEGSAANHWLGGAFFANHNSHPSYNVLEGNMVQIIQADGENGSSSDTTIFRNWIFGTNSLDTIDYNFCRALEIGKLQVRYNVVGNVIGAPGPVWTYMTDGTWSANYTDNYCYAMGYGGIGSYQAHENYTNFLGTMLLKANWDYATRGVPVAQQTSDPLPDSLIYTEKPAWWGSGFWPPYGPYEPTNSIPAERRALGLAGAAPVEAPVVENGGVLSGTGRLEGSGLVY